KELTGFDACFFCLGGSSSRMTEEAYRQLTYGFTVAAGQTLSRLNPHMTMVFVSGEGTDETGKSRVMWARVKGEAENALRQMPFKAAYMFRPGYIQPLDGIVSRERVYRYFYAVLAPFYPLWKILFPGMVTNTRFIGQAMIQVAKKGSAKTILRSADINEAAAQK
ncbi:MAG TPA: epimerase, partial [bacterium]|nr:epimerase [bacterium]